MRGVPSLIILLITRSCDPYVAFISLNRPTRAYPSQLFSLCFCNKRRISYSRIVIWRSEITFKEETAVKNVMIPYYNCLDIISYFILYLDPYSKHRTHPRGLQYLQKWTCRNPRSISSLRLLLIQLVEAPTGI